MLGILDRKSDASKVSLRQEIGGGAFCEWRGPKMASAGRAGWAVLKKWFEANHLDLWSQSEQCEFCFL